MPNSPAHKKGPPRHPAKTATDDQHRNPTPRRSAGQVENRRSTIQAPRDPILRALWQVSHAADLTPQEKLAYLVLWRYLKSSEKPLGAALFGRLLGISSTRGADIFSSLQRKGYLNSTGKFRLQGGHTTRAERSLTGKLSLPKSGTSTGKTRRESRRTGKSEAVGISGDASVGISDTDPGVGQGGCPLSTRRTPANEPETHGDHIQEEHTISIADLIAADAPVKKSEEGAA